MGTPVVEPLPNARFGARVRGLDPGAITDDDRRAIWAAHRERHGLLCFEFDELLTADELHRLTSILGENELAPGLVTGVGKGRRPDDTDGDVDVEVDAEREIADLRADGVDPYLAFIGNVDPSTEQPKRVDENFYGEWEWHTDMSYLLVPPTFSLLHARMIPPTGGDTGFCSQVMAAAELPAQLRARIEGRSAKHDSTYASSGKLRPGMTPPASPIDAEGAIHPILRRVPTTGEEALFLGRRTNGYVCGLALEESEQLLDELWAEATRPEYCYQHAWTEGEVVVWDNRMLLHKRHPVAATDTRFMWRTQTKGEPVQAAS